MWDLDGGGLEGCACWHRDAATQPSAWAACGVVTGRCQSSSGKQGSVSLASADTSLPGVSAQAQLCTSPDPSGHTWTNPSPPCRGSSGPCWDTHRERDGVSLKTSPQTKPACTCSCYSDHGSGSDCQELSPLLLPFSAGCSGPNHRVRGTVTPSHLPKHPVPGFL